MLCDSSSVVHRPDPALRQDMLIVILRQRTPSFLFGIAFFAMVLVCAKASSQTTSSLPVSPTAEERPTDPWDGAWSQAAWSQTDSSQTDSSQADSLGALPPSPADSSANPTVQQKTQRYHELIAQMRQQIRLVTKAKLSYYLDGRDQSYDWKDQWETGIASILKLRSEFERTATDLYIHHADDPRVPETLPQTMSAVLVKLLSQNRHHVTEAVLERLIKLKPDNDQLKLDLALTYLKTNRFAAANRLIATIPPAKLETLDGNDDKLMPLRFQLESQYEKEQEILAAESDDDLPRVELLTSQGPVIVELFENQAPDTVGNFIHLVESDFYTDVVFHRVIDRFMAQTGLIAAVGDYWAPKSVDYTIYDETENSRGHFYGYLSMAKTDQADSGNAQFFITFEPTTFLDRRHTVFGRVIQGMEAVGSLQTTFVMKTEKDKPPEEVPLASVVPDRILAAKVIRKRDHQYRPNKVGAH